MRKWIDLVSENLKSDMMEGLKKVGAYTNRAGAVVTMHQNTNDPQHLMLVSDGQVVGNHVGAPEEYHAMITADGMSGALLQEEELAEDEVIEESHGDRVDYVIAAGLDKEEPYIGLFKGDAGDGLLHHVIESCKAAGANPSVVQLGHNCVGKGMPDIPGGLVILDVAPANLPMCLGEQNFMRLEGMIMRAPETGRQFIIVCKGENSFRQQIQNLFPVHEFDGGFGGGRDIEDGGIHRIV